MASHASLQSNGNKVAYTSSVSHSADTFPSRGRRIWACLLNQKTTSCRGDAAKFFARILDGKVSEEP